MHSIQQIHSPFEHLSSSTPNTLQFSLNQEKRCAERKRRNSKHNVTQYALYASGLGTSGQLGVGKPENEPITPNSNNNYYDIDQVNTPVGIPASVFNYERIKSIQCGWYHSVVLTDQGSLYSCGAGYSHQSGHYYTTNIRYFKKLATRAIKGPVKQVSCGGHHTLCLTEFGKVYAFGEGREGQTGTDKQASSCPSELTVFEKSFDAKTKTYRIEEVLFTHVAAGGYHSILIDEKNRAWTFGKNSYGQLGLLSNSTIGSSSSTITTTTSEEYILQPTMVTGIAKNGEIKSSGLVKFASSAAGAWHSIFLTTDGQCYGCGDTQYGQIGIVRNQDLTITPSSTTSAAPDSFFTYPYQHQVNNAKSKYTVPEHIEALSQYKIKSVACGYFHTVFVDVCGRIFTCGWGAYGQTGTGSNITERLPRQIMQLKNIAIHTAACGWNHVVCIDKQGNCYGFGEAKHGQLAQDTGVQKRQLETPERLDGVTPPICKVACGRGHTLFLVGDVLGDEPEPYVFSSAFTDVHFQFEK